ncbi:peptidase C14 [Fusarium pseudocircinatum]|uniref:Peptidase C14 n=1 Tax=Fusarium pseudocircinatum TaxID=56676 RepID=A0A8H5NWH4_9HYPO|nr:peptidase C14 [Fusarium pseudocircinatum]
MATDKLILVLASAIAILAFYIHMRTIAMSETLGETGTCQPEIVSPQRGVDLVPAHVPENGEDSGIDIIAIHGLNTKSPETWTFQNKNKDTKGLPLAERVKKGVNWLTDKHMLPSQIPDTYIYTCDWPAELFETKDLAPLDIDQLSMSLLKAILGDRPKRDRPILFIASCLGGIILINALVKATGDLETVREATRGIIFLGTPFRGTYFGDIAYWAEPGLGVQAVLYKKRLTALLKWVNGPTYDSQSLLSTFTRQCILNPDNSIELAVFYENRYTNLTSKYPFLSFLMPKGLSPTNTPIERADTWICRELYSPKALEIKRLSGDALEMEKCYINLAIVQQKQVDNAEQKPEEMSHASPFTLAERLKLQVPHDSLKVDLKDLFQRRELAEGTEGEPKRILIHGRAGIGKTTLCKKIVYEIVHNNMWKESFKRVIWIPLRGLKTVDKKGLDFPGLLECIFSHQQANISQELCTALYNHVEKTSYRDTLLLLDGLDEVTEILDKRPEGDLHPRHTQLVELLNRPNVIITARPHAMLPGLVDPIDLKLDTIGFAPDQVQEYVASVMPQSKDSIQQYIQKNRLLQSLVQIPIQLDALCYTWQGSAWEKDSYAAPKTMTAIYETMIRELWLKDCQRIQKKGVPSVGRRSPAENKPFKSIEYKCLAYLAFSGMYSNVIEFHQPHRSKLHNIWSDQDLAKEYYWTREGSRLTYDETFDRLSFFRTSQASKDPRIVSYHFIHLTFQEYFAAQHFVESWKRRLKLRYVDLNMKKLKVKEETCLDFLQRNKYSARYNIMWRFVAGLLDTEPGASIDEFIKAIESEPIDLFGPTHQRLLMYCFAETEESGGLKKQFKEELANWIEFECNFSGECRLVSEMEVPEESINLVLERASDTLKLDLFSALRKHKRFRSLMVNIATGWLKLPNASRELRHRALSMFSQPDEPLGSNILYAVMMLVDDTDTRTSQSALSILEHNKAQPVAILKAMVLAHAEAEVKETNIQSKAAESLQGEPETSRDLVQRIISWANYQKRSIREEALGLDPRGSTIPVAALQDQPDQSPPIRWDETFVRNCSEELSEIMVVFLTDYDERTSHIAAYVLRRMGKISEAAFKAVSELLNGRDEGLENLVLQFLPYQRAISTAMLEGISTWLSDYQHTNKRHLAFIILGRLGQRQALDDQIIQAIGSQIKDPCEDVHLQALGTLKFLKRQQSFSQDVVQNTAEHLKSQSYAVKRAALGALGRIGQQQTLSHSILQDIAYLLHNGLGYHNWPFMKSKALAALSGRSKSLREIHTSIAKLLTNPDAYIRESAANTLASQSDLSHEILLALTEKLQDSECAEAAACALGSQKELPQYIKDAMLSRSENADWRAQYEVAKAIQNQSGLSQNLLNFLLPRIKDQEWGVRSQAIGLLKANQTLPDSILQAVTEQLDGYRNVPVRKEAMDVLQMQKILPHTVVTSKDLYSLWLKLCFQEHLCCYIQDGVIYIEFPTRRIPLMGEPKEFERIVKEKLKELFVRDRNIMYKLYIKAPNELFTLS